MTLEVVQDLALCDCCLMKLANDDTSGCDFHGCHINVAPMQLLWDVSGVVLGDAESDEFSTVSCDGCGDPDAGRRTAAHVLGQVNA